MTLERLKKEKRFKDMFAHLNDLSEALGSLRISQRTVLSVFECNDADISKLEKFAEDLGIAFPDPAPAKDGSHVPREGRSMPDKLKYSDLNGLFPPPDVSSFVLLNNLTADVVNIIVKFLMSYRDSVLKQFTELFDLYAASLNNNEDLLVFYIVDLYSHCDSKFRNLRKLYLCLIPTSERSYWKLAVRRTGNPRDYWLVICFYSDINSLEYI